MSEILEFSKEELTPARAAVLGNQGIPTGVFVPAEIDGLCTAALDLLSEVAAPAGVLREISKPDFENVYQGEGRNEAHTPVAEIYGSAENLALFAVTLGEPVSKGIDECFRSNELALGSMLDAAASIAADHLAELAANRFLEWLLREGRAAPTTRVLGYSPGYCGWHVSGQKKLFEYLRPEQIGITLRDSFLMQPLKSVSGVLIAGSREIHSFEMAYPFCSACETRGCRARIRALRAE
jgi:hypothetical protein